MGTAAAFIGLATGGWSVMKAPMWLLNCKKLSCPSYKNARSEKFSVGSSVARNTSKIIVGD
jgi:hypothetical protein